MSSQDSQSVRWHFTTELNNNDFEIHGRTLFFIVILFAIAVVITLLFLYARWVWRYQHHHFPSHPPTHAPPSGPRGLHPTIIKAIPITSHRSSSISSISSISTSAVEAECCICLGVFENGERVKVLPLCHHSFHSECLDRWLAAGSSCPLCRASLHCGDSATVSISTY